MFCRVSLAALTLIATSVAVSSQGTNVVVKLKNGRTMAGVVDSLERKDGEAVVLRQPSGASGRIVLPAAIVADVRRSSERVETTSAARRAEIVKAWRATRAKERSLAAERRVTQGDRTRDDALVSSGRVVVETPDVDRLRRLIERFHPNLGFTPGRRDVIEWRKWTLDVFPGAEERAWLAHYDEWLVAWAWWLDRAVPARGVDPSDD